MSVRRKKELTPVDLSEIKKQITLLVQEQYGSVNKFSKSEEAKKLGIEKSVTTILSRGGRNSLPVINKLCKKYSLPAITLKTKITVENTYFSAKK